MIDTPLRTRVDADNGEETTVENKSSVSKAISYMDRTDDYTQLKNFTINRYGTTIKRRNDDDETTSTGESILHYDKFLIGKKAAAIAMNNFEIVPTGLYGSVVDEVANLFSIKDSRIEAAIDGVVNEEVNELLNEHREAGSFWQAMEQLDRFSVAVNVAWLRIGFVSGHIQYDVIRPQSMWLRWPGRIQESYEKLQDTERVPSVTEIEDAAAVIVQLSTASGTEDTWQAYAGRSDEYPQGRCVTYKASKPWPLPDVGTDAVISEYDIDGAIANPFTWLQNVHGVEKVKFEYPFTFLLGTPSDSDVTLLPVTTTMHKVAMELDSSTSRNLTAANKAANGTTVIKDPQNRGLPDSVESYVALRSEQDLTITGRDASNAANTAEIIKDNKRELAESNGVPGYRVLAGSVSAPESGSALIIRHQPQIEKRKSRVRLNREQVLRTGYIELQTLALYAEESDILNDASIQWNPGEWRPPVPRGEVIDDVTKMKSLGVIDIIEITREIYQLNSRDEARDLLEQFRQANEEFGDLTETDPVNKIFNGFKKRGQEGQGEEKFPELRELANEKEA